ncbi:MAG: hypothetical protein R3D05_05595 [Dongiaceae bacterium]
MPDLLIGPEQIGYDLEFDAANQTVLVDFRDPRFITAAIAADFNRFSVAAFQTVNSLSPEVTEADALAWATVKLYYAAFYSGHALMRLLGESCSHFDRVHVTRIIALATAIGKLPSFNIDSGLYHCIVSPATTAITCRRARGSVGGTHEAFWQLFGAQIQTLSGEILRGPLRPVDAQAVFSQLQLFLRIIRKSGAYAHSWLSVVRNDLQYRHRFGVWYPTSIRKREREVLARLADQWRRDPMEVDLAAPRNGDLGAFVVGCAFVLALCRSLLVRIAERSTAGSRGFMNYGPIGYFNHAGLIVQ